MFSIESAELLEHFLWKTPAQVERQVVEKNEVGREKIAGIAIYLFELAHNRKTSAPAVIPKMRRLAAGERPALAEDRLG